MAVKSFTVNFSNISKTESLLLTTRVKDYWKRMEIKPNNRPLNFFLEDNSYSIGQLKTKEYNEYSDDSIIPIIDQSSTFIIGYSDQEELIYNGKLPVIIFGDHTRNFKYVNFPFIQGADGIKILYPNKEVVNPLFFYYLLKTIGVSDRGYNRHYSLLSSQRYSLIDISIQNEIANLIQELETEITHLKNSKENPLTIINKVFGEEFGFDWEEFERLKNMKQYYSNLIEFSNNIDCRFSYRFQHYSGKYLMNFLKQKTNKRIKDFVCEPISLGASISPANYDEEGDYYYVSMATVKKYFFDKEDAKKVSIIYSNENLNKSVKINDIIMTRSGMAIGKFALIDEDIEGIYADFTMRIRLLNFNPLLAYYYFRSDFFQHLITTHKKGLQNHNIFPSQIQEFPIPDWSEEKQAEITEKIKSQIDAQNIIDEQIEAKQQEINRLIENAIQDK